jgi:hypothetical protein
MRRSKSVNWDSAAASRLVGLAGGDCSVEAAVVKVVHELLGGLEYPPTKLEALLPKLGVVSVISEDLPFSGELRSGTDGFTIVYSKHLNSGRRRFTIAHEMGHALLANTGRNYPRVGKEVERLCDMLAAEILMPEDAFVELLPTELSFSAIFELAKTFETSWWATAIRCTRFRKVSVFEADSRLIRLSTGFIRTGPVSRLDCELQDIVETARRGTSGEKRITLMERGVVGSWIAEFTPVAERARVLLRPCG